ncbi:unnamed protein product [Leuciscus chuanchicus]
MCTQRSILRMCKEKRRPRLTLRMCEEQERPQESITGTSGRGGMEKQMAVFQSLRIPDFCANSEAGVSESRIWAMPEVLVATGEPSPDGWDKAEVTVAIIRD